MKIWSNSFKDGDWIPTRCAFGKSDGAGKTTLSSNRNPHLTWSHLPEETRSIALVMYDIDVPSKPDDVHQAGKVVSADLPRVEFDHWVAVGLSPDSIIEEGALSYEVTPRGKTPAHGPSAIQQGINNYTDWFASDPDMKGEYYGYDGPCPPYNDELVHRYRFTVYALDTDAVEMGRRFTRVDLMKAIEGHVLAEASIEGKYKIYDNAIER